jgi:hypothetical protein
MLAAIALTLALSAPALPASGVYRYNASVGGTPAGTSTLQVGGSSGAATIAENASGSLNGMAFSGKATLSLGADLSPSTYGGSYTIAGQNPTVSVTIEGNTATVDGPAASGGKQTISLGPQASHFVVVEPGLLAGMFVLPAQMHAWNDAPVLAIAPAYARSEMLSIDPSAQPARPAGVPAQDVALSLGGRVPFTIWYDPATFVPDEIVVPSQNASVTRIRE